MNTGNQLHRLPGTALNVMGPGVVVVVVVVWWWFILPIIIPHQPSCFVLFVLLVELWQFWGRGTYRCGTTVQLGGTSYF
jgi:hypothetical protein